MQRVRDNAPAVCSGVALIPRVTSVTAHYPDEEARSLMHLSSQVKYTACNVDDENVSRATTPADVVETQRATLGQGDTHQLVHTAILESPTVRKEKESVAAGEATNVSVGLLHQLIEELENKSAKISENAASSSSIGKERIATWEEKEERFIRTIERTGYPLETATETLRASESACCFALQPHEEPNGELKSRSSQHVASTSRETCLEEVQIERYDSSPSRSRRDNAMMEEILTIEEIEAQKASGEAATMTMKKKKKRGLSGRLRKFFRAVFGRKN